MRIVATCLTISLLSACTKVGPDYHDPTVKVSKRWMQASKSKYASVKEANAHHTNWWKSFRDPTLDKLIQQGVQDNLTLQTAGVRVLYSRAQLAQTVGQLYPQTQAGIGNYTYTRIGSSSLKQILPPSFDSAALGFTANWEIDFWGKYRRAIESNDASFLASIASYDNALVSLTADIASTYINIRTYQALIGVTRSNIQLQKESLQIVNSRYRAGQTSLLDVQQAKTQLSQTEAQLPAQIAELQVQKNKLAVLLGIVPNQVDALLTKSQGIPRAPAQVEVGIPKQILCQRPDVAEARFKAMARSAAIGATKANLFPALSLSGTFTFSSTDIGNSKISDMFRWSSRYVTAGPAVTWPILNYGQITNAVRMQDASFQEALLNYLNTVLKAQEEVQNYISKYIQAKKTTLSLSTANQSAIQSSTLSLIRYKEGETIYTTVLDSLRQQLQVQSNLTTARGDIALAVVGLYRSLGGGWEIRKGKDIVPEHVKQAMSERTNWGILLEPQNHLPPVTPKQQFEQLYLPVW
ncbi:efflux transporter outer membrane subunit [Legionella sp. W05-934-2]|jgi:NodT family efflux transporter outer membrane factor (OMF) lipoprotein|uniref:efflux transporter outer membrane subunit n=1 Tax=Legionella sp. W05-934-2 TaxID=1198649 RepID=UPI0034621434